MTRRDVLVRRIQHVQSAQEEARHQLASAIASLGSISQVSPGQLREKHAELDAQLKNGRERTRDLARRLPAVDTAAAALFKEWERELALYQNAALRELSERQLATTRARYGTFVASQQAILGKMEPALVHFKDQVLFIKHGLNAQARSELNTTLESLLEELGALVRTIDESTHAADAFIQNLNTLD